MDQFMLMDDSPADSYSETTITEVALHVEHKTDMAKPGLCGKALEYEVLCNATCLDSWNLLSARTLFGIIRDGKNFSRSSDTLRCICLAHYDFGHSCGGQFCASWDSPGDGSVSTIHLNHTLPTVLSKAFSDTKGSLISHTSTVPRGNP